MSVQLSLSEARALAAKALEAAGVARGNAACVAHALAAAEADGIASHGLSRVPFYADQAASGKVDGNADPLVEVVAAAAVAADARDGFAYPAIRAGLDRAYALVVSTGVVALTVANSHHCGANGYHVEQAAERGLVALMFANTPAGIAPWGGHLGTFGTNPIAFACPREECPPLVIDLSLAKVARGKVMLARQRGEPIPEGWAIDADGRPTTDPEAALAGTMLPIGDAKGAALALVVEILSAALAGSQFGFEASSFFTADGPPPRVGQSLVLLQPETFAGDGFIARVEALLAHIEGQPGTRLPGQRRLDNRARAAATGVEIPEALHEDLARRAAALS
jgi:(2R)-3-sulfolactate dehydrogenase (NADP+)